MTWLTLSVLIFVAITITIIAVAIIFLPKKDPRSNSSEEFYCWVCHTFDCGVRLHKRMAENAIRYKIPKWQFYSAENKTTLIREGHFKCPTFKRNYEQTEKLLKGKTEKIEQQNKKSTFIYPIGNPIEKYGGWPFV